MKKKTHEQFINEVSKLTGNEYIFLDKYIDSLTKIRVKHTDCNEVYWSSPSNFLSGRRCPRCRYKDINTITNDQFLTKARAVSNDYVFLEKYTRSHTKIRVKHIVCGHIFSIKPYNFLNGRGCRKCAFKKMNQKTHEHFIDEVKGLHSNEYEVIGEYQGQNTKIKLMHMICGRTFEMIPKIFLSGSKCVHCHSSKGEEKINNFLTKHNIKYTREYRIKDCKYKRPLPFDFAVFDSEEKLSCLIEYDGEQHFTPIFGQKSFLSTQRNDQIKDMYCRSNSIKLIRIPYTELNSIPIILEEKLRAGQL